MKNGLEIETIFDKLLTHLPPLPDNPEVFILILVVLALHIVLKDKPVFKGLTFLDITAAFVVALAVLLFYACVAVGLLLGLLLVFPQTAKISAYVFSAIVMFIILFERRKGTHNAP
jgi:uncharacterized membrane protein YGL010W